MADATPYNLDAVHSNGFVDFYKLLEIPQGASNSDVQDRIQALYSEAQANRDHRNLNKRRDYQTLLEYLPQARAVLLDSAKRPSYDEYAAKARGGSASTSFSSFMGQLSGASDDEDRTDVLGVQDGRTGSRNTGSAKTSTAPAPRSAPDATGDTSGGVARRQPQVSPRAQSGPPWAIIGVAAFVIIAIILFLVTKH